jgi:glycosyltransferase involved in cell wall biosynthesis
MYKKNDLSIYPFKTKDIYEIKDNFATYKDVKSILEYDGGGVAKPDITIGIPTYNAEFLHQSIESCINQVGFTNYEVIIVDNNKETWPQTLEYIRSLNCNRIRYYRNEKNIGMFGNWNRCLELARGEYYVMCHADDMLVPDTLVKLWNLHLTIEPKAAILGQSRLVDEHNNVLRDTVVKHRLKGILPVNKYKKYNNHNLFWGTYDNGVGELFHRESLIEIGGWNPNVYPAADQVVMALYQKTFGLYRINEIIRCTRLAINESNVVGYLYPMCDYHMILARIDKWFAGNQVLKLLLKPYFLYYSCWGEKLKTPVWWKS